MALIQKIDFCCVKEEGRLWSLYHLLTIVCLSGLMWSSFSKRILRVPHLQCSKIISEILCRHISNFKSLIVSCRLNFTSVCLKKKILVILFLLCFKKTVL